MKKVNFFLIMTLAVFTLASCNSRMSEEEINQKVDADFEALKPGLEQELDALCETSLVPMAEGLANSMADSLISLEITAVPGK